MSASDFAKIPVTIVTGFLGAGKTTVIRNLLENASRHGAPPIRVEVTRDGPGARLSVIDAGASGSSPPKRNSSTGRGPQ